MAKKGGKEIKVKPLKLFNVASEISLIGAVLLRPSVLVEIRAELDAGAFGDQKCRAIFEAMVGLSSRGDPVDMVTIANELEKAGNLEKAGGNEFLGEILGATTGSAGLLYHIREVKECQARRSLAELTVTIQDDMRENVEVTEILSKIRKTILHIKGGEKAKVIPLSEALNETVKMIEALCQSPGHVIGVPSGFSKIDRTTGGWQAGELIYLAGRPGMGKSVFAKDLAENAGVPVAYFSLEMSTTELVKRQLSGRSRVNFEALRTGRVSGEDWDRIMRGADGLTGVPIFYVDRASLTIEELEGLAQGLKMTEDIGLIVIDYLQLLRSRSRSEGREREVSDISRRLKALARDLQLPVICLCQLNRQCEMRGADKRPILSDLRESGSLEQDADIVAFLYRASVYDQTAPKHGAEFIVAKGRNIRTGRIKLFFDGGHQCFENFEEDQENDGWGNSG
jgi:replicative DNA helicase